MKKIVVLLLTVSLISTFLCSCSALPQMEDFDFGELLENFGIDADFGKGTETNQVAVQIPESSSSNVTEDYSNEISEESSDSSSDISGEDYGDYESNADDNTNDNGDSNADSDDYDDGNGNSDANGDDYDDGNDGSENNSGSTAVLEDNVTDISSPTEADFDVFYDMVKSIGLCWVYGNDFVASEVEDTFLLNNYVFFGDWSWGLYREFGFETELCGSWEGYGDPLQKIDYAYYECNAEEVNWVLKYIFGKEPTGNATVGYFYGDKYLRPAYDMGMGGPGLMVVSLDTKECKDLGDGTYEFLVFADTAPEYDAEPETFDGVMLNIVAKARKSELFGTIWQLISYHGETIYFE